MRKIVSLAGVLALLLVVGAQGQEMPVKPGPEHEKFKELAGTWDAAVEFMGQKSKGTATWQVGLGGLWLLETFKGEFEGTKFEGRGATTYDPAKKKYINIWIDSMSTTPMISEGTMDKNKLTLKGKMTHDGKTMDVVMTSEMKDRNTVVFTMTGPGPKGKQEEMMKITYTRKGKAGKSDGSAR